MKAMLLYFIAFALALLCLPMLGIGYRLPEAAVHTPVMPAEPVTAAPGTVAAADEIFAEAETGAEDAESFLILDETTGEVREVPLGEFVRGAVAAEMPASFHPEALRAQAVAAHTFALQSRLVQRENPDPALKGADFSADPANLKVYITEEIARDFYGDQADEYWTKICEAADAALPYVLEYDGEPIVAAYHAISGGMTEDAGNVWSGSAPYLAPVESAGDMLAPGYETTVTIPAEELRARLMAAYPETALPDDPAAWFGEITRTEAGYVKEIAVGDSMLPGKDIRRLLGLRSHNFEVLYTERGFQFVVVGYGHGVGLSQYGADYMARQGSGFQEILSAYYTGATLVKTK